MTKEEFKIQLITSLVPLLAVYGISLANILYIEANPGGVHITLIDGRVFALTIMECEEENK